MKENTSQSGARVRYNPVVVTLHWLITLLILAETLIGVGILHFRPNTAVKIAPLAVHMVLGIMLLFLVTAQIILRSVTRRPNAASAGSRFLDFVARSTHGLLYLFTLLVAGSGLLLAERSHVLQLVAAGHVSLPMAFEPFVHAAIFVLFGMLVGLHVLGALYHQFVLKDRLWSRMGYRRSRKRPARAESAPRWVTARRREESR